MMQNSEAAISFLTKTSDSQPSTLQNGDQRLQSIRRLDWRFLLPDPSLRRVAYIGPQSDSLLPALRVFSESLRIIHPSPRDLPSDLQSFFDLVVLHSSNFADLTKAAALLMVGGTLYWEIDRPILLRRIPGGMVNGKDRRALDSTAERRARRSGGVEAAIHALDQHGLCDIDVHWHRPNFDHCVEIIPWNEREPMEYYLSRSRSDLAGRVKMAGARLVLNSLLWFLLARCLSIVGRKRAK